MTRRAIRLTTRRHDAPEWRAALDRFDDIIRISTSGALSAHHTYRGGVPEGRLRGWYHVIDRLDTTGVVLSYGTPIAIRVEGAWLMIAESHSVTTSRHQGLMRLVCDDEVRTPAELRDAVSRARGRRLRTEYGAEIGEIANQLIDDGTPVADAIEMARRLS